MNISERDKKILIIFGILCFLVLSYYVFYSPYTKKITTLKKEVSTLQNNLNSLKIKQNNKAKTNEEIKTVSYQLQNYRSMLPAQLVQELIIKRLAEMESNSGISLGNYSFAQVTALAAQPASNTTQANSSSNAQSTQVNSNANGQKAAVLNDGSGIQTEVKCSISGTYKQFKALVDEVINSPQVIRISNISLKNNSDDKVTGTISFTFYGLYDSKAKASDWEFKKSSGKDNIFSAFPGYSQSTNTKVQTGSVTNESTNTKIVTQKKAYSLIMTVSPESADLPSVILGKSGDKAGLSYVYADSNKVEDVELELADKDGKLYCRYKTQLYSYPKNYSNDITDITAEDGVIAMQVVSSPRKNEGDISGVNLKVKNSTSLPLVVKIENDDSKSPRVKITTIEGKVSIE